MCGVWVVTLFDFQDVGWGEGTMKLGDRGVGKRIEAEWVLGLLGFIGCLIVGVDVDMWLYECITTTLVHGCRAWIRLSDT